jgi:O-antigen/teichoic acid export membrane protein
LRTVPALLAFWAGGVLLSLFAFGALFAKWPWRSGPGMHRTWFSSNLRASGYLYFADITGTLGQFIDRYLVALLIDLEHAGIYTLFFQLANAIYTLVASSIMNIHRPKVVSSFRKGEVRTGASQLRVLQREALLSMVGLSVVAGVAFQFVAPLLQRPMVLLFLPLLWCTFAATVCKAWCLTSFIALYARQLDRALFALNVFILVLVSLGCLVVLPLLGIYGIPLVTGITYLCTLFFIRKAVRAHTHAS